MPAFLYLQDFGMLVFRAYKVAPYLVGSALTGRNPKDIDIRLMLNGEEFERYVGDIDLINQPYTRWATLCQAFSALGEKVTGLPIDFQFQLEEHHGIIYKGCPRLAISPGARTVKSD